MTPEEQIQRDARERSIRARVGDMTFDELSLVDELVTAIERHRHEHGPLTIEGASRGELEPMLVVAYQLLHETRLYREKRRQQLALVPCVDAQPSEPIAVSLPRTVAVDLPRVEP